MRSRVALHAAGGMLLAAGCMLLAAGCMLLAAGCNEVSRDDFAVLVEDARSCAAGDTCQLAGAGQCTCATPVNASRVVEIDEAVMELECEGAFVDCAAHENVRCEAGRCVSD